MSLSPNHPYYSSKPIRSIAALCKALKLEEIALLEIARIADSLWKPPHELKKEDGDTRTVNDAKPILKALHRRIHGEILSKVIFPIYITGSVKGHDYSSNAKIHSDKAIVITEDIKSFFPNSGSTLINEIWQHFFGFSIEVAEILTKLTCKDGCLPQGGICSSYLANLAFWDIEGEIYTFFLAENIYYSRYVDDITISCSTTLDTAQKTKAIAKIFGMLNKKGFKAKRAKHEIHTQAKAMIVTKLVVNDKVSLTKKARDKVRSAVYQVEKRVRFGERGQVIAADLRKVISRVGILNRFHK